MGLPDGAFRQLLKSSRSSQSTFLEGIIDGTCNVVIFLRAWVFPREILGILYSSCLDINRNRNLSTVSAFASHFEGQNLKGKFYSSLSLTWIQRILQGAQASK